MKARIWISKLVPVIKQGTSKQYLLYTHSSISPWKCLQQGYYGRVSINLGEDVSPAMASGALISEANALDYPLFSVRALNMTPPLIPPQIAM